MANIQYSISHVDQTFSSAINSVQHQGGHDYTVGSECHISLLVV